MGSPSRFKNKVSRTVLFSGSWDRSVVSWDVGVIYRTQLVPDFLSDGKENLKLQGAQISRTMHRLHREDHDQRFERPQYSSLDVERSGDDLLMRDVVNL